MGYIIKTTTGRNYIEKITTTGDAYAAASLQMYEKQVGSDGAANTVFTLQEPYQPGSNTLMVFVDGVKAESVTSASSASQYEETDKLTVTFGAALAALDVVEFVVAGAYIWDSADFESLLIAELPDHASTTVEWQGTDNQFAAVASEIMSPGYYNRGEFIWSSATNVLLNGGAYNLMGTTNRLVKWESQINFAFAGLGNNETRYVYLDDSNISAAPSAGTVTITTSGDFIHDTQAPTWSDEKQGYYNSLDRCIFAVRTGGSANILEFFHDGDLLTLADAITVQTGGGLTDGFVDATAFTMPTFVNRVPATFLHTYADATGTVTWRTNGQTGSTGHQVTSVAAGGTLSTNTTVVTPDSSGLIEVKETANSNTLDIYQHGWYLPEGM